MQASKNPEQSNTALMSLSAYSSGEQEKKFLMSIRQKPKIPVRFNLSYSKTGTVKPERR